MLTPEGLSADAALARLGDAAAAARIARMASSEAVRDKSVVAAALQQAGAKRYAYALVPLLRDASPVTRMAAASAVAALGYGEAISALRPLLTDPFGPVRTAAAVALRQLGDRSGDKVLADGARGTAPDQPIVAMEAAGAAPGEETVAAVTSLLAHKDPLVRLRAAEVLGRAGLARPACRAALEDLLASADAGIRQEAARVFELLPAGDPQVARRLLRDPNPWVRLYAAGTLEPPPQSGGHDAGGSRVQGSVW
jgi:HEAT repeat protein